MIVEGTMTPPQFLITRQNAHHKALSCLIKTFNFRPQVHVLQKKKLASIGPIFKFSRADADKIKGTS
jgi:hypothetical protein